MRRWLYEIIALLCFCVIWFGLAGCGEDDNTPSKQPHTIRSIPTKTTTVTPTTPTTPSTKPAPTTHGETQAPAGYGNGDRATFRFSKPGQLYGTNIHVVFSDGSGFTVPNGANRYEPGGGFVWKPVSENTGKLAVIGAYGKKYTSCTVY